MNIRNVDWFMINVTNMKLAAAIFKRDGFILPSPRCFGKPVSSFDLSLRLTKTRAKFQWKLVFDKIVGLLC